MKHRIPKWLKAGAGALGVAGLLAGGIGMVYDGAPAPHAAHAHVAMVYDIHSHSIVGE